MTETSLPLPPGLAAVTSLPRAAVPAMPVRVQFSRSRGWRKPAGTVLVARGTRWGNPFLVAADGSANRERAVAEFRLALLAGRLDVTVDDVRRQLKGQNLGCWCPLDRPCHADVLLEVANS